MEVFSASALVSAMKNAVAGDVIALAPGVYSDVSLKNLSFSAAVTITSADPDHPAVLVDFALTSVTNVTLQNLSFEVGDAAALSITNSQNIVVDNVDVSGASDQTLGGNGIKVTSSEQVTIKDSHVHHLGNGVSLSFSEHVTVTGNVVEYIRVDGIRGNGSSWVEISDNELRTFKRNPGEHGDAIQFFTVNTTAPTHDIRIIDNLIERGEGGRMQGIFMRDESKGKTPYINVEISGNTLLGTGYNGIAINFAQGAIITNNTVVGYEDQTSWISLEDTNGAVLRDNTASSYRDHRNVNFDRADNVTVSLTNPTNDDKYVAEHFLRNAAGVAEPGYHFPPSDVPVWDFGLVANEGWLFV